MTKGNTENGVSIEGDIHIRANNVIKNGSSRESYAPLIKIKKEIKQVDDENKEFFDIVKQELDKGVK